MYTVADLATDLARINGWTLETRYMNAEGDLCVQYHKRTNYYQHTILVCFTKPDYEIITQSDRILDGKAVETHYATDIYTKADVQLGTLRMFTQH